MANLVPKVDNTGSLGTSSKKWSNVHSTTLTVAAQAADLSLNSQKITNLGTPTANTDAATKAYVDGIAQGLSAKDSVRVATTANGTLASAYANGQAVDGVTLATNDRILIKNQTSGAENGIYTVNASGAPTRAVDFDANAEVAKGAFVFVEEGSTNANAGFVLTTDGSITLGSTALAFTQFSGAGQITAGDGISKTGNTLAVDIPNTTEMTGDIVDTDELLVSDGGALRRADFSVVRDAVFNDISGDAAVAAGGALTIASAAITGQTAKTSINDNDLILLSDSEASGALKKMTKANFVSGIGGGSTTLSALTDTDISSPSAGHILVYDGSNSFDNKPLSGDATIASSGALTIAADAVSYAKIQNVSATDKILGRSSSGAGVVEEIACTAAGRALLDDANAAAQRTTLGLVIGTNVQAYDAELAAIAGLTSAANKGIQFTGSGTAATYDLTAAGKALLDDADAAAQRTTLGLGNVSTLAVGISNTNVLQANSNVADDDFLRVDGTSIEGRTAAQVLSDIGAQASDAGLSSIAGLTTDADKMIYTTGSDTYAVTSLTAAGRAILDDADAAAQRTTLGLAIGTNVQAYDAELAAIAGLTSAANKGIQFTGSGTAATYDLTAAGKALLDDADAAAQRVTLGVGTSDSPTFAGATAGNIKVGVTGDNEIDTSSGNLTLDSAGGTVAIDDNLTVSGNASITGNLTVSGTTTTLNSEVALADRFMMLNSNYTTNAALDGGIVVNVDPSSTVYDGSSIDINFNSTTTVQIAGDASSELAANKIFIIRNAEDAANNGLYQVHSSSHSSGTTTVTIKDASSNTPTASVSGIVNTSFTTNSDDDSAVIAKTKIAILKSDTANNVFEVGFGDDASSISYTDLATSGGGITGLSTNASDTLTIGANYNLIPNTAGSTDLGSASAEYGDVYIADDKMIKFGSDQDSTIEYDEDGDNVLQIAGANVRIGHGAATQLQFRDSAVHISSDADGYLNAQADTGITLNINGTDELALTGSTATFGTNIVIPNGGNIGSAGDTDALAISATGLITVSSTSEATSSATGALRVSGGLGVAKDLFVGDDVKGFISLVAPHGSTKTITVTVAAKSAAHRYNGTGSSSGYKLDGVESPFLTLTPGRTYKFDQADSSNSGHPLRFYYEADKTTAYTTGVTTSGTPGSSGAYTQIVVSDTTPLVLHYQCSSHAHMGNSVLTSSSAATRLDLAGTAVTASGAEINVLDGVTAGTVTASKALVVDANKDLGTIRNLTIDGTFSDGNYTFDTSGNVSGLGTISSGAITSTGTSTFAGGITPAAADGAALGSSSAEWSDLYLALGGQILFGNQQKVTMTHEENKGLKLKNVNTGDGNPFALTLQTGETDVQADDVIGKLDFQAPDEGTGTDAILVCAGIEAVSEGDFSSSNNATKLSFKTAASEAAAEKMSLSSTGNLKILGDIILDDGGSLKEAGGTAAITFDGDGHVTKIGQDSPSNDEVLTWDGTNSRVIWAAASGGGTATDLTKTSGNITIDSQGNDTDIIFKGTDGGSDTTFLTLDGSDAGTAIFNNDIRLQSDASVLYFGADGDARITHIHESGLEVRIDSPGNDEPVFSLFTTNSSTNGPTLRYQSNSTSPAQGDTIGQSHYKGKNAGGSHVNYAKITGGVETTTSSSESGNIEMLVLAGGTETVAVNVEGTSTAGKATVDLPDHDGSAGGLKLAGTLVTSTAAELNILDGVTATTAELNILDGVTSTAAELNILDGVTATTAELNLLDGATSATSTTIVDADRVIVNDNGTMKQVAMSDIKTYTGSGGSGSSLPPEVKATTTSNFTVSLTPSNASTFNDLEVIYAVSNGSTAVTATLPTAASIEGKKVHVKRLGTANVTVDGDGSETIDGSATFVLTTQYSSVTMISDGTNWIII